MGCFESKTVFPQKSLACRRKRICHLFKNLKKIKKYIYQVERFHCDCFSFEVFSIFQTNSFSCTGLERIGKHSPNRIFSVKLFKENKILHFPQFRTPHQFELGKKLHFYKKRNVLWRRRQKTFCQTHCIHIDNGG